MEPIIYSFPKINQDIKINESKIEFDDYPSPKLIKYGFNYINETLDMVALTSNSHYKAGLNFDFDRTDQLSMKSQASKFLKVKNFDLNFAELWEICVLFKIFQRDYEDNKSKEEIVYCTKNINIDDIIQTYQSLSKTNKKFTAINNLDSKLKNKLSVCICKFSDSDLDENAMVHLLVSNLKMLLECQKQNAIFIIQISSLQTKISVDIIYYLSSLYNESYLMKPSVTSDMSDNKYLILIGLNKSPEFNLSKIPSNKYPISIGIDYLPNDFTRIIQCINSEVIPRKYNKYNQIMSYLESKIYEGATYQDMIKSQDKNTERWFEIYTNIPNASDKLDYLLKKSDKSCPTYAEFINIIS